MKIFKISQNVNNKLNTYNAAVVVAINEDRARLIHPSGFQENYDIIDSKMKNWFEVSKPLFNDWCRPEEVKVKYIGETKEFRREGVIIADYNGKMNLEQSGIMTIETDKELLKKIENYYLDVEDDIV